MKVIKRIVFIVIAAAIMALNINSFVDTGGLYPGGATGLTILIQRIFKMFFNITVSYTLINVLMNAIPVYIGFRYIGKKFTMYSVLMIFLTGIFADTFPSISITSDILLIAVFGGIINGFAISLCLMVDATSGGTDFLSIYLSEKKGMDSWNIILGINVVIIGAAGFLFGWDKALYSMIFQYASTQVLHLLYQKYQQQTLFVVTKHPSDICKMISNLSNHGATILKDVEGAYKAEEKTMVYSVVSRAEYKRIIAEIRKIDPEAFINTIRTDQLVGRFYHRPAD